VDESPEGRAGLSGLLERVRAIWIDDVLDSLVPDGVYIDLESTEEQPAPGLSDGETTSPAGTASSETPVELFDRAGSALLILGEPGSGKTVSLLELTRGLIQRAEVDPVQPVPAVFKLSSWQPGKRLESWLIDELSAFYKSPKRQARQWLRDRRILPMLDGLDEVGPSQMEACVEAINTFIGAGTSGLAVTCRTHAYTACDSRLMVNAAYRLGDLAPAQVMDYVAEGGSELRELARALESDPVLLDTARTPLMLRLIGSAYRGLNEVDVRRDDLTSVGRRRDHVLDNFAQQAFSRAQERHEGAPPFTEDEVQSGLEFIGRGLRRHSDTILLLERMQPSWLEDRRWRLTYLALTRLGGGVVIGFVFGVLLEIILTVVGGRLMPSFFELTYRMAFGMIIGFGGGILVSIIDLARFRRGRGEFQDGSPVVLALIYLVAFAAFGGLLFHLAMGAGNWAYGFTAGLVWGFIFWTFFGFGARNRQLGSDIRMAETLRFVPSAARRNTRRGLVVGLLGGGVFEAVLGIGESVDPTTRAVGVVIAAIAVGALGGVIGGIAGGLQRGYVRSRLRPGEGLHLALRNMLLAGGVVAAGAILVCIPLFWIALGGLRGASVGLVAGVFVGVLASLWSGGMDLLRHIVLRAMLVTTHSVPRPLEHFLNYATELGFLQRAGGAYLFVHNLLLDYFAGQAQEEPSDANQLADASSANVGSLRQRP
jgi:eukaryotic-like serine/threonine-protein kinase